DVEGGIICGRGTPNEFTAPGLAQAAIDAVKGDWKSPTGRKLIFHPDHVRYGGTYVNWLSEKRDWCISRQLWWGHRIPIWLGTFSGQQAVEALDYTTALIQKNAAVWIWSSDPEGTILDNNQARDFIRREPEQQLEILVCLRNIKTDEKYGLELNEQGFTQDPDVLDTWFSSALWPHSTLGWPDPTSAQVEEGQSPLKSDGKRPDTLSYYYPGSCLVTGRDIITLWVARMVITGLYNLGDVPFTDSFIHANILDGKGERMSKSKGNGIDPVDIIDRYGADAMRYVLCDMQTGTQDIRLPVQAVSPFTQKVVDLATADHGQSIFTYICPDTGKEFDVLGTMPDLPAAKIISDRFDVGKHFCNKLWNAARFALLNLVEQEFHPLKTTDLLLEDQWILSRLTVVIQNVTRSLKEYNPAAAIGEARRFFWGEFCDWYLELLKPRFKDEEQAAVARQVLAAVLDQVLRLLHPIVPFITEEIWEQLNQIMPVRGIEQKFDAADILALAAWPIPDTSRRDEQQEARFKLMQEVIREIRNVRSKHNVPPGKTLKASLKADSTATDILQQQVDHIKTSAHLHTLEISTTMERPPLSTITILKEIEIYLEGVLDPEKERSRLLTQQKKLLAQSDGLQKKLANENFVKRAPADVVEKNRQKLEDITAQLKAIAENLDMLQD
ncbi:class I tRNA ligase family protein, partial [candidate division CSSED10-310 bacterium]